MQVGVGTFGLSTIVALSDGQYAAGYPMWRLGATTRIPLPPFSHLQGMLHPGFSYCVVALAFRALSFSAFTARVRKHHVPSI